MSKNYIKLLFFLILIIFIIILFYLFINIKFILNVDAQSLSLNYSAKKSISMLKKDFNDYDVNNAMISDKILKNFKYYKQDKEIKSRTGDIFMNNNN